MQAIGYTVKLESEDEKRVLQQLGNCETIYLPQVDQDNYSAFAHFITTYKDEQLVVVNMESIGLQMGQLEPLLTQIIDEGFHFTFLQKPVETDQAYLRILHELAISEKKIISNRTLKGLEAANAKGIHGGRPGLNPELIKRIKHLRTAQRKSIREIADDCNVSLGTVHKYINLKEN